YMFEEERRYPYSYTYRDYVIRAFNEDLPFDQFILQQVAADLLPLGEDKRPLAALGYLTVGRRFLNNIHDIIDDRIDVVCRGLMGLTVSCARCHDHKYDPIPTKDYYSLYGVFNGSTERALPLAANLDEDQKYAEFVKGLHEREEKLNATFRKKCDELSDRLRNQTVEYLNAVLDVDKLPSEEFYAIRGPDDLNPTIVRQWDNYLRQTAKQIHPVFAIWHELAPVPAADFAARASEVIRSFSTRTNSTSESAADAPLASS